jgi:hypothetical protein
MVPDMAVGSVLSHGAPDTVRCASHVSRPLGSTVGALTCGASGLSGGAPDRSCRLSGAPSGAALSSARRRVFNALQSTVAREVAVAPLAHRTIR